MPSDRGSIPLGSTRYRQFSTENCRYFLFSLLFSEFYVYKSCASLYKMRNLLYDDTLQGKMPGIRSCRQMLRGSVRKCHRNSCITGHRNRKLSISGGAEGNRTPVRKQLGRNFSGRSLLFTFPHPGGNKHPTGISSFMMRGMGKAYHTHGLHFNHTLARPVDLPGRMGA